MPNKAADVSRDVSNQMTAHPRDVVGEGAHRDRSRHGRACVAS